MHIYSYTYEWECFCFLNDFQTAVHTVIRGLQTNQQYIAIIFSIFISFLFIGIKFPNFLQTKEITKNNGSDQQLQNYLEEN